MGDRCYMQITCRKQDVEKFLTEGFTEEDYEEKGKFATVIFEERNWGDTDDIPKDVPFFGWHSEGGEYGSMEFVCDGDGNFKDICTGHNNDGYVVSVDENGNILEQCVTRIKEFLALQKKVEEKMGWV